MDAWLGPLLPVYEAERALGRALVLAVVLRTEGSTYRKAGAMLAIAADGRYAGLLSGGCLEGDLRERARDVLASGRVAIVSYDLRTADDPLWGLGVGCEGAMDILLLPVGPATDWQPLAHFAHALAAHRRASASIVIDSPDGGQPAGRVRLDPPRPPAAAAGSPHDASALVERDGRREFFLSLSLPPRLLLLGAGPDALPVLDIASRLGWKVSLADHRPAYARAAHFARAERVFEIRPEELLQAIALDEFDACVVMSHHLPSDLEYLRALAASRVPYVGLLGPAARREKLLGDLGVAAGRLRPRLRAPVGLALGGRAPESIALAIVAEIHAFLHGREGGPFSHVNSSGFPS